MMGGLSKLDTTDEILITESSSSFSMSGYGHHRLPAHQGWRDGPLASQRKIRNESGLSGGG